MLGAVLFDMGGTLDGLHWLDRFVAEYARAGSSLPREVLRQAFDAAERRSAADDEMLTAGLDDMVERHLDWQLDHLRANAAGDNSVGTDAAAIRGPVARAFVAGLRADAAPNVRVLAVLKAKGLRLGVVSNACGNVDRLCEDLGFAPYLSVVVDSRRVGVSKPDPAIYMHAVTRVGLPPSAIMMVGDSFERDIQPARSLGMHTAWLEGASPRACSDPSCVDLSLRSLTDLIAAPALSYIEGRHAPSRTVA